MKKVLLAVLLFASSALAFGDDFCNGYQEGYKAGYCHNDQFCIPPIPPMCPMPNMGESTFQDGYNRGFLAGLSAR